MATLHVRNVPDELYELLRARAARNARSIGAEAIQLLEERLAGGPARASFGFGLARRRQPADEGAFARFSHRARQAVAAAQEQARDLGHDGIDTGHLLLGVLQQEGAPVVACLRDLGVTGESARAAVERARPRGEKPQTGQLPFQPGAKRSLEIALRESLKLGHTVIGCEHLVLGIAGEGSGPGAAILREAEPDAETLRRKLLPAVRLETRTVPDATFRVIPLEGDAESWERQLNDAAAFGFELLEIVDGRAILRRD